MDISALRAVAGPMTFRIRNFMLVMIPLALVNLYTEQGLGGRKILELLAVLTLATAASALVYWLSSLLVRYLPLAGTPITFLGLGLTGLARGAVMLWASHYSPEQILQGSVFRLGAGLLVGLLLLGGAGYFANAANQFREDAARLFERKNTLEGLMANAETLIAAERTKITEQIEGKLGPAIAELQDLASNTRTSTDLQILIAKLLDISTKVVRPISHVLRGSGPQVTWQIVEAPIARVSLKSAFEAALKTRVSGGRLILAAWAVDGLATIAGLRLGAIGVTALATYVVTMAVILAFVSRYLDRAPKVTTGFRRVISISGGYLAVGLIPGLLASSILSLSLSPDAPQVVRALRIGDVLLTFLFLWAARVTSGVRVRRVEIVSELEVINRELAVQLASMRSRLRLKRLALARILHGNYQSTFVALAADIQNAVNRDDTQSYQLSRIQDAVNALSLSEGYQPLAPSVSEGIEDLASFWSGAVTIKATLSDEALQLLDQSDAGRSAFFEVANELVTNTVKHSRSTAASLELTMVGVNLISVDYRDNGEAEPESVKPGSGLQMIAEHCVSSDFRIMQEGFRAVLTLAV